ncbi:hypothetical protein BOX15_Mlig031339g1 [Macrostomum lignano]|uniref:WSC domain-containing protein n=2 Tax=Macrostomum lignano TaxID=282301 RepID=A0A1I8FYT3_9PLAT|nr:hypothetical protein BOX15_Mlig031339g1 [Macrostomum lignano]
MKLVVKSLLLVGFLLASVQASADFSQAKTGCYKHSMSLPALGVARARVVELMSPAICYRFCKLRFFPLFGLRDGRICHCGQALLHNAREDAKYCQTPCVGQPSDSCGGPDYTMVYDISRVIVNGVMPWPPPLPNTKFLGCYKALKREPLLDTFDYKPYDLTKKYCLDSCFSKRFVYFGLLDGNICQCGQQIKKYQWAKNCNMPCSGKKSETCGGVRSTEVYEITK